MIGGRQGKARAAIVTITPDELRNAKRIFEALENVLGTAYYVRADVDKARSVDLVLTRAIDRSNLGSQELIGYLIEDWRPDFIFLVGTAGGVNARNPQPHLGDVVIADYIEYVEFVKLDEGQYLHRVMAIDHPSLYLRSQFAEPLQDDESWHADIGVARPDTGKPRVITGNVAAGEKIFGDAENPFQQHVVERFDKVIALEMESAGVARAVCRARSDSTYNPQYLTIRGICDIISQEANDAARKEWTDYAASAALAFTKKVVENVIQIHGLAD